MKKMQQDVDPHSGLRDARHDRNEDGRPSGALAADAAGQGLTAVPHSTHFDAHGQAHMVDVGDKASTRRIARAQGRITMSAQAFAMVRDGTAGKGDVLGVARVAAIQGTKRTAELIPLCHPLALTRVAVEFTLRDQEKAIAIEVTAETTGPTGVEMEALTGACVGLLTVYDMCKSVDRGMRIAGVHLVEKAGGKSGHYLLDELPSDTAR